MLRLVIVLPVISLVALTGCSSNDVSNAGATTDNGEAIVDGQEHSASSSATPDPDLAALAGTWETVRMVSAGEEVPPERIRKDITVTFENGQLITWRKGEVQASWPFTIDSSKSPKQMIVNTANPGAKDQLSHQIYKIEGDTLTTCSGGRDFPAEFTENTVKGCFLTVRKRVAQ